MRAKGLNSLLMVILFFGLSGSYYIPPESTMHKIGRALRNLARSTIAPDLEIYWYEYDVHVRRRVPVGYNTKDIKISVLGSLAERLLTIKKYPWLAPLVPLIDADKVVQGVLENYSLQVSRKAGDNFYVLFVVLTSTAEARTLAGKISAWKASVPPNPEARKAQDAVHVGRYLNILYIVRSDTPEQFAEVEPTLNPPKK